MNFRRSKQSKPKRSANTSLYVAHHSSFATSCHNGEQTKEFAFAKLEKFLITAKEKAKKTLIMVLGCWFWVVGWVTCSSWLWVVGFGIRFALLIEKSSIRKGNLTKNL